MSTAVSVIVESYRKTFVCLFHKGSFYIGRFINNCNDLQKRNVAAINWHRTEELLIQSIDMLQVHNQLLWKSDHLFYSLKYLLADPKYGVEVSMAPKLVITIILAKSEPP